MLIGERVRLRALDTSDAEVISPWYHDYEFSRLDGWRYPTSLSKRRQWLESVINPDYRDAFFGVEEEGGQLIGLVALRRAIPEDRSADFGIAIEPGHQDQGYGADATRTILRFGFREMNLNRISLRVLADNPRAQHVYEKCGFVVEGKLRESRFHDGHWTDHVLMAILEEDYAERSLEVIDNG